VVSEFLTAVAICPTITRRPTPGGVAVNASRLREQVIEEWSNALAALAEYEFSNESARDLVGEARVKEALRVLHRIATAGGIKLPNVPDWLKPRTFDNKGLSTFDQRQALEEGWCLMCDSRGNIEIERDDAANTCSRPALGLRVFKYDEEALEFVTKHAADGSPYHQQALAIVEGQFF
jgi:hypothetical protein